MPMKKSKPETTLKPKNKITVGKTQEQPEALQEDIDYQTHVLLSDPLLGARALLYTIVLVVISFIVWAYFAKLDERTLATGKVIPSMRIQEIQNLEGGILRKLSVREGDVVNKNQVLMQIDDTGFLSKYKENSAKYYALMIQKGRLIAEASHARRLNFPKELTRRYPDIVAQERRLFSSNQDSIHATLSSLRKTLVFAKKELAIIKPLAQKNIVPKLDSLKLEREVTEIQGKINSMSKEYLAKVHAELAKTNSEIRALHETLVALKDRQTRTTVRSPAHGIVKKININTPSFS